MLAHPCSPFIDNIRCRRDHYRSFFTLHDKNHDGYLDRAELAAIYDGMDEQEEHGESVADIIDSLLHEVDVNRDGRVSRKEFLEPPHENVEFDVDERAAEDDADDTVRAADADESNSNVRATRFYAQDDEEELHPFTDFAKVRGSGGNTGRAATASGGDSSTKSSTHEYAQNVPRSFQARK